MISSGRQEQIKWLVLSLYRKLPHITFPLNPLLVIDCIDNCRYLSYQKYCELNHCGIEEVVRMCHSKYGCTHYRADLNRFLILCNNSTDNENSVPRQRFTCCHEIGHVVCGHLTSGSKSQKAKEEEADYFSATILAPLPLFQSLNIKSPIDVQNVFYISAEAALYRYKEYLKFCKRSPTQAELQLTQLYQPQHQKRDSATE